MPRPRLRCPHCSAIDWSRAPELHATLVFMVHRGDMTSRDIADTFGLGIANASNRMRTLEGLEFVSRATTTLPSGGVQGVFTITRLGRESLSFTGRETNG